MVWLTLSADIAEYIWNRYIAGFLEIRQKEYKTHHLNSDQLVYIEHGEKCPYLHFFFYLLCGLCISCELFLL